MGRPSLLARDFFLPLLQRTYSTPTTLQKFHPIFGIMESICFEVKIGLLDETVFRLVQCLATCVSPSVFMIHHSSSACRPLTTPLGLWWEMLRRSHGPKLPRTGTKMTESSLCAVFSLLLVNLLLDKTDWDFWRERIQKILVTSSSLVHRKCVPVTWLCL